MYEQLRVLRSFGQDKRTWHSNWKGEVGGLPYKVCGMIDEQNRIYELYLAPKHTEFECLGTDIATIDCDGWVVPNRKELLEIYERLNSETTTVEQYKIGGCEEFEVPTYWSSTEYIGHSLIDGYVCQDFCGGGDQIGIPKTLYKQVRLVYRAGI